jgi:general secretion pathway protein D
VRKISLFPALWSAGWNLQVHADLTLFNPYLRTKPNTIVENKGGERWTVREEERIGRRREIHNRLIDAVDHTWSIETSPPTPISFGDEGESFRFSESTLLNRTKSILLPKINFVDLPLSQVIQVLSELSEQFDPTQKGVNLLLIDPQKKNPAVTLNLKNISLYKTLCYIARITQFYIKFEHDVAVFSEDDDKTTEFFPVSRGTVIQIVENSNEIQDAPSANPEETILRRFFQKSGIPFDIPGSGFAFDGNQFIVTHTPTYLKRFKNLLKRYRNIQQVSIEAKFLEIQQGTLEETGIKWQLGESNQTKIQTGGNEIDNLRSLSTLDKVSAAGDGVLIINQSKHSIVNRAPLIPNNLNGGKNVTPVGHIMGVLNRYQMQCFLQALEQHTDADLMSAPKLTVLSGKRAEIVIAQELRYPECYGDGRADVGNYTGQNPSSTAVGSAGVAITAGTPSHFVTRNVGVEMSVLPTVERNNCISLKLEPSVTEFDGFVEYGGEHVAISGNNVAHIPSGFFQPIFSRRQIKTEVTVFNGATVVMGGLTREEVKEIHDKVPFLGNLPLLGPLFRSKGQTSQKRNLLILVTANRLDPAGIPTEELGKKREEPTETKNTISIETPSSEF